MKLITLFLIVLPMAVFAKSTGGSGTGANPSSHVGGAGTGPNPSVVICAPCGAKR